MFPTGYLFNFIFYFLKKGGISLYGLLQRRQAAVVSMGPALPGPGHVSEPRLHGPASPLQRGETRAIQWF